MPIRFASPICARVNQVLQDFLPTELDLIDTEEGDGIVTPDVANGDYYEVERSPIPRFPAITTRLLGTEIVEARSTGHGNRIDARHSLQISIHTQIADATQNALRLKRFVDRYVSGILRVLLIIKSRLETTADPTGFAEDVLSGGPVDYIPINTQRSGAAQWTGTIPITVRIREVR